MSRWSRRLAADAYTVRRAQRTYGTTDPGGVWHPVHRRECLTILLGTYAEKGQCNRPTTTCIVFGTRPALPALAAAYAVRPMRNRMPRASPRRVPGRNPRPAIGSAPSRYCGSALPCDPSLAGVYPFPVKIASGLRSCPPRHLVAEH